MKFVSDRLRKLPSVASVLEVPAVRELLSSHPRQVVLFSVRNLLERFRRNAVAQGAPARDRAEWISILVDRLPDEISERRSPSLRRVINATGVIIHTNLGRAPLAEEAISGLVEVARGFSNLEFDLDSGMRTSRLLHVERMLLELSGAEAAHVVNNNSAAVLLCLAGLARGREVVVSRGELVEIGGSFRIPDIMAESGARLVEVGTTNRTRLDDYERAITSDTALLMKVHRSNFTLSGFTEEVSAGELASLGSRRNLPVLEDLGSGAFHPFAEAGVHGTPTVREALAAGPGLVTVSGDKLLGGPQAGIILGRSELVAPLRKHPLSRALRVDKLCIAALSATLRVYADQRAAAGAIPVLRMMLESEGDVRKRAIRFVRRVRAVGRKAPENAMRISMEIVRDVSSPGGGAMPGVAIPTSCVAVSCAGLSPGALDARLRAGNPPAVARLCKDKLFLDMRTVSDGELSDLAGAILDAASRVEGQ